MPLANLIITSQNHLCEHTAHQTVHRTAIRVPARPAHRLARLAPARARRVATEKDAINATVHAARPVVSNPRQKSGQSRRSAVGEAPKKTAKTRKKESRAHAPIPVRVHDRLVHVPNHSAGNVNVRPYSRSSRFAFMLVDSHET